MLVPKNSPLVYQSGSPGPPPEYVPNHNTPTSSETTPLMGQATRRNKTRVNLVLVVVFVVLVPILFQVFLAPYLQSSVARERVNWDRELMERRLEEKSRIKEWERMFGEKKRLEKSREEEERANWDRECEERRLEEQSRMKEWERMFGEKKRLEKLREEEERANWDRECEERRLEEQSRMKEWERQFSKRKFLEKLREEEWNKRQEEEHLREAQWQREEEQRESLGLYWAEPEGNAKCTAYNTRDYKARLLNTVPYNYNWLKPCEEKPITIHNRSILTTYCEIYQNGMGEVYGHWRVNFDEPACTPYWDQFKDKGCTAEGSRYRRIEAHLENIQWGEDWEKLCASAPHDFYGRHFDHPDSCANWGSHGIFGIWDIEDPNC